MAAVVSAYTFSSALAGTMAAGVAVSCVTQTITATVSSVGTYSISTTANGVTFAGSGTFAGTGAQDIVLTATGTPTAAGSNSFTLNTTPSCSFTRIVNEPSSNGTSVASGSTTSTAGLGVGTTSQDANAILDITSTTQGVLLPRHTADPTGVAGMVYYNTTDHALKMYNGSAWITLTN